MKRLLLALALVLVVAVPASAESVVVKPMMIYTTNSSDFLVTGFYAGDTINCHTIYEVKGIGDFKVKLLLLDRKGALIDRLQEGPYMEDETTFQLWWANPSINAPDTPGYYTLKVVYTDVASKKTWSHRTRVHVSPPPP